MLAALAAVLLAVTAQPAGLDGTWLATELRTAKGRADVAHLEHALLVKDGRFEFASFNGTGKGKAVLDAKGGRLDLEGAQITLHCTFTITGDRLTLTIWPDADARRKGGDPIKGGAFVYVFERVRKRA